MKINKELLKGSTTTLLLSLLQRQDMYGYEMVKAMELRSEGVFQLKEGTLYPILHSLEKEGWIEGYWSEQEGRKRKYYQLTKEGQKLLGEKQAEWKLFRSAMERVLGREAYE